MVQCRKILQLVSSCKKPAANCQLQNIIDIYSSPMLTP